MLNNTFSHFSLVPVLAVGYGDVMKRMDIQDKAAAIHRTKLAVSIGISVLCARIVCIGSNN